jgi:hypothetical protein
VCRFQILHRNRTPGYSMFMQCPVDGLKAFWDWVCGHHR